MDSIQRETSFKFASMPASYPFNPTVGAFTHAAVATRAPMPARWLC